MDTEKVNGKTAEVIRDYAALLRERLGNHLLEVVLFGSQARGDAREGSDYDVMVVVDWRTDQVREAVLDVEVEMMNRHEALFATMIYEPDEWEQAMESPLGWCIKEEGVSV